MRKLLLASAAVAVGSLGMAGGAHAQFANVNPTAVAPPPAPFTAVPSQTPGPGSITVRLNARLAVNFYAGSDSGRNATVVNQTASGSFSGNQPNTKLAQYSMGSYARLYPGFDGVAGNGLKYGASLEIRQDQGSPPGGGINASVSASNRSRAGLYWRRETLYVGADKFGYVRYGSTDGAITLFTTGTFENFNDGGWNGDLPSLFTGNTTVTWPFADVGALYTTEKVVYLSPQYMGFDFGVSFEPGTGAMNSGPGNCSYNYTSAGVANGPLNQGNGTGCDAATSTSVQGETGRRRNTIDGVLRYRGAFGPVGVAATFGGIVGSHVGYNGVPDPAYAQRQGLGVYDAGLQFTYGGLAFGGHLLAGKVNGQWNLLQSGQKEALAYIIGTSYAFGPFIVGASYLNYKSAGAQTMFNNRYTGALLEQGIAAGGTYTFAPGMNVFLSYLYGSRRERGVDLLTGTPSLTAAGTIVSHNTVQSQGYMLGTAFSW